MCSTMLIMEENKALKTLGCAQSAKLDMSVYPGIFFFFLND